MATFPDAQDALYELKTRITDVPREYRGSFQMQYENLRRRVYALREHRGRAEVPAELDRIIDQVHALLADMTSGGTGAAIASEALDDMAQRMERSLGFSRLREEEQAAFRRDYEQLRADMRAGRAGAPQALSLKKRLADRMRSVAGAAAFAPKDSKFARWFTDRGERVLNPVYVPFRGGR